MKSKFPCKILLPVLVVQLFAVAACTEKGKPYQKHEGAKPLSAPISSTPADSNAGTVDLVEQFKKSPQPIQQVLVPLADKVLDPVRIQNPQTRSSEETRYELRVFNSLLLTAIRSQSNATEVNTLLQRYKEALQTSCSTFQDSCAGLIYFQQDAASLQVIKNILIHQRRSPSPDSDTLIYFALKMGGRILDHETLRLIVQIGWTRDQVQKQRDLFVSTLLLQTDSLSPSQLEQMMLSIGGWKALKPVFQSLNPVQQRSLAQQLGKTSLLRELIQSETLENRKQQSSIDQALLDLRKEPNLNARSFGADLTHTPGSIDLFFDQVLQGSLSAEAAAEFIVSLKQKPTDLEKRLVDYIRIRFLQTLVGTHKLFAKFLKMPIANKDRWSEFRAQSSPIRVEWQTFLRQMDQLRNLQTLLFKQSPDGSIIEKRLITYIDSMHKEVAMASAHPQMLVLFALASQEKFDLTLGTEPYVLTIDSKSLLAFYFSNQRKEEYLRYSNHAEPLTSLEALLAFDSATRSGFFQTLNIPIEEFIAQTVGQLGSSAKYSIQEQFSLLRSRTQASDQMVQFRRFCDGVKSKQESLRTVFFDEVKVSPIFGTLIDDAFTGISTKSQKAGQTTTEYGLFYAEPSFAEMLELARLDIAGAIRVGESLLHSAKGQAPSTKWTIAEEAITELKDLRRKVLTVGGQVWKDFGTCYWQMNKKDQDAKRIIYEYETAYIRQVHSDIKRLRQGRMSNHEVDLLMTRHRFSNLPSGFKGLSKIQANGWTVSSLDVKLRVAKYLTDGLVTATAAYPPVAANVQINYGSRLDIETPVYFDSHLDFVPYSDNVEDFVNRAKLLLFVTDNNQSRQPTLSWFSGSALTRLDFWSTFMVAQISLLRLQQDIGSGPTWLTAEDIFSVHEAILDNYKLDALTLDAYQLMKLESIYPLYSAQDILVASASKLTGTEHLFGLFDFPVRMMFEPILGRAYTSRGTEQDGKNEGVKAGQTFSTRTAARDLGKIYYDLRIPLQPTLSIFPWNQKLLQKLESQIIPLVKSELHLEQSFLQTAQRYVGVVRQRPGNEQLTVTISRQITIKELLQPKIQSIYNSELQIFHQQTGGLFR